MCCLQSKTYQEDVGLNLSGPVLICCFLQQRTLCTFLEYWLVPSIWGCLSYEFFVTVNLVNMKSITGLSWFIPSYNNLLQFYHYSVMYKAQIINWQDIVSTLFYFIYITFFPCKKQTKFIQNKIKITRYIKI